MRFSRDHQSHAAICRHASTRDIKSLFWNTLDVQYEELLVIHKDFSVSNFCAVQRARLPLVHDSLGEKLRTAASWLRAWRSKENMSNVNKDQGDAK